jgi:hypothetical protein
VHEHATIRLFQTLRLFDDTAMVGE